MIALAGVLLVALVPMLIKRRRGSQGVDAMVPTGAANTLATVRRAGEPYTFGFEPAELLSYLAKRNLTLIEDVGADAYRERYLMPRGRGAESLSEYQRAALASVGTESYFISSRS